MARLTVFRVSKTPDFAPDSIQRLHSAQSDRRGFDAAADLVLERMERVGWSVSELSAQSGVTRETLSYWLNAKRPLRADYLLAVLRVLGLSIV